jgi:hypothetical protein
MLIFADVCSSSAECPFCGIGRKIQAVEAVWPRRDKIAAAAAAAMDFQNQ